MPDVVRTLAARQAPPCSSAPFWCIWDACRTAQGDTNIGGYRAAAIVSGAGARATLGAPGSSVQGGCTPAGARVGEGVLWACGRAGPVAAGREGSALRRAASRPPGQQPDLPPAHTCLRPQAHYLVACWYVYWLMFQHSPLPPHFAHMRLLLRGQAGLLLRRRRAWLASLATTTLDSFAGGFLLSSAYNIKASA